MYYIVFGSVDVSKRLVAILTFGINSGAYVAGDYPASGIMSVDQGQFEAGRSLGTDLCADDVVYYYPPGI